MNQFLESRQKTRIISTSASPILGLENSMTSTIQETREMIERSYAKGLKKSNPMTAQLFMAEKTASPHPRFLGLARTIFDRRGKKVDIRVPRFQDTKTSQEPTEREPIPG